jgi:hypothetical protein
MLQQDELARLPLNDTLYVFLQMEQSTAIDCRRAVGG